MKIKHFRIETHGFYGAYFPSKEKSRSAVILMLGDDAEDYMARCGAKWVNRLGVNALTMAPDKKDYSHHNYPLERIETAIQCLYDCGNTKIGIAGASTTGTLALTAASYFNDITLTIALTPSDFVWQGFMRGNKDGCKEWPVEGESLFSYRGEALPYMPFAYKHPQYWQMIESESKRSGDLVNSKKLFEDSEIAYPLRQEQMIKVENIKGKLLFIGAEDDVLWDTAKYIRRMDARLRSLKHSCEYETLVYPYGTHFVFPETMLKIMLPIASSLFVKMCFVSAKQHPKECKKTRLDIDYRLKKAIKEWRS